MNDCEKDYLDQDSTSSVSEIYDTELRKIQVGCSDILKRFSTVCEKNGLRYFLAYGTLLGALRHKGFIPWDDDVDVWMPRPDMETFLNNCHREMAPFTIRYYSFEDPKKKNYRYQPSIEDQKHMVGVNMGGRIRTDYINIDIMPLDGMPSNHAMQRIRCGVFRFWYMMIGFARSSLTGAHDPDSKTGLKKLGVRLNEKFNIGKYLNVEKCLASFDKMRKKYSYDDCDYIIGATSLYTDKAVFPKEWFSGERKLAFEGDLLCVPKEAEKVLEKLYGDYMKLSPEDKRRSSHISIYSLEG